MGCSNQLGFASLIGTLDLSPHENILTIALINIHFLYKIQLSMLPVFSLEIDDIAKIMLKSVALRYILYFMELLGITPTTNDLDETIYRKHASQTRIHGDYIQVPEKSTDALSVAMFPAKRLDLHLTER